MFSRGGFSHWTHTLGLHEPVLVPVRVGKVSCCVCLESRRDMCLRHFREPRKHGRRGGKTSAHHLIVGLANPTVEFWIFLALQDLLFIQIYIPGHTYVIL